MAVSPNVLAGLAAALGGGMKAFNQRDQELEQKRQFDEQQTHNRRLLQRAIANDELAELRQQEEADNNLFTRSLSTAQQGFKTPISEETRNALHPLVRDTATKALPQPTAPATLLGLGGDVLQRGEVTPGPQYYQFEPTESEKARIAAATEAGRQGRFDTGIQAKFDELGRKIEANTNLQHLRNDGALQRTNIIIDDRREGRDNNNEQRELDRKARREAAWARTQALPAGVRDELSVMKTLQDMGGAISALGDSIEWKGVGGMGMGAAQQFGARHLGTGSPESERLRNFIANMQGTVSKLRAGTALSAHELELLKSYVPTINENPMVVKAKIQSFNDYVDILRDNKLAMFSSGGAMPGNNQPMSAPQAAPTPTATEYDWVNGKLVKKGGQ